MAGSDMTRKSSRRNLIGAGAALLASRALAQNAPGPPPGAAQMPPMRPPVNGPQLAPPAAPILPPFPAVGSVEQFDPGLADLIDVNTPVEKILDGFVWVEGPVWIGDGNGYLLCSDTRANKIIKWQMPAAGSTNPPGETWLEPGGYKGPNGETWAPHLQEPGTNGMIRARGGLLVADQGNRALALIDLKTKQKTKLADRFEGKRFNSPNDMVLHANGMIFFTDPPYGLNNVFNSPDRELDYTGVFRLNPDNSVTLIDKTLRPNGIGLSPDGSKLYCTDTSGWVVFDLDARGNASNRRVFVPRSAVGGGDGFKVDEKGNVWASSSDGITIFSPDGRRLGRIRADNMISNCEFGADGYLYMSSNKRLIRARVRASRIKLGNA
jgi:gluconolactonase